MGTMPIYQSRRRHAPPCRRGDDVMQITGTGKVTSTATVTESPSAAGVVTIVRGAARVLANHSCSTALSAAAHTRVPLH
jgi:hypothetical protein